MDDLPTSPRFATLARDGWALVDAERAYRLRDGVYWVPPAAERWHLRQGMLAKLVFVWAEAGADVSAIIGSLDIVFGEIDR